MLAASILIIIPMIAHGFHSKYVTKDENDLYSLNYLNLDKIRRAKFELFSSNYQQIQRLYTFLNKQNFSYSIRCILVTTSGSYQCILALYCNEASNISKKRD